MTSEPRRRNAATTRLAILASARAAFARAGYDGVGLREIAAGAGVTAVLVNRYFGSKEQLFAEVAADTMATSHILTPQIVGSANIGNAMAAALIGLTETDATPLDGFMIMLRSASSEAAAQIGREQIEAHAHKTLTGLLKGELAAERAAVILSLIAGFQAMRQMIGLTALADAQPQALVKVLGPAIQQLIDG